MFKKFLLVLFCVLFLITGCACTKKDETAKTDSTKTAEDLENESRYLIEKSEENIISVELPTDYEFSEEQNEFFADFVLSKIYDISGKTFELTKSETAVEYNQNYSDYYIDIESKTTYISDNIISIVFTGLYNKKSAAHPINLFFALNFDPKTMNIVQFSSIHTIDDSLYNEFVKQGEKEILDKTGGIWPEGWDSFPEMLCSKETFFDGLNGKNSEIEWYYTENGIGFSYSVPYALGNHREVELSKSVLKIKDDFSDDTIFYMVNECQYVFWEDVVLDNDIDYDYFNESYDSTTQGMIMHKQKYIDIWYEELKYSLENFLELLTEEDRARFEEIQANWETSLKAEYQFVGDIFIRNENYQLQMGSIFPLEMATELLGKVRERTLYIKYLQYCMESGAPNYPNEITVSFVYKSTI